MIRSLSISNVALIEKLDINFHEGLNVLSGETGAGKSIVVDAVSLILGGRAEKDLIRTGTEKASVEAEFDVPGNEDAAALLRREDIEYDGRTIIIRREISRSGRNICRICGVVSSLTFLKELAPYLMDIHGQQDHRFLLDPSVHLSFLDQLGGDEHIALLDKTAKSCAAFLANHREYSKLVRLNEKKDARIEQIKKELGDLKKADLKEGEEERLTQQVSKLRNSEKISVALRQAADSILSVDSDGGPADRVRLASGALKLISSLDDEYFSLSSRCEELYYELQELGFDLSRAVEKCSNDPYELEKAEKKLSIIKTITKRYGTLESALAAKVSLEDEYSGLMDMDNTLEKTSAEHKKLLLDYRKKAKELSASRHSIADKLKIRMENELSELGMSGTVFDVAFIEGDRTKPKMPTLSGDDSVEFMMSANPGEPVKPLARIASGGELSRIMLAFKSIQTGSTGLGSMVFDEIDTGISGRMAQVVAEKMINISRDCQVICVTHLPQIAAAADYEYLVRKQSSGERTVTVVVELDSEGRKQEVARMISGAGGITDSSMKYAAELLSFSERCKRERSL